MSVCILSNLFMRSSMEIHTGVQKVLQIILGVRVLNRYGVRLKYYAIYTETVRNINIMCHYFEIFLHF